MIKILGYEKPNSEKSFVVYDPAQEIYVTNYKLTLNVETINSLEITTNEGSPLFKKCEPLLTHVEFYEDNKLLFRGRMIKPERSMDNSGKFERKYVFEDCKAYLMDSVQRFYVGIGKTPKEFLKHLIDTHNKEVPKYKEFTLGKVDVTDDSTDEYRQIDYPTTWDAIKENLLDELGGYITTEYKDGKWTLNYLKSIGTDHKKTDTPIKIGSNMKSIQYSIDPTQVVTRLVPLGATLKNDKVKLGNDGQTVEYINETEGGSGATHAIKGDWTAAIKHAASLMNVSLTSTDISNIKNMIQGESGGSETVVNNWDSNAKAGTPSAGLLQFIEPTFKAYMCSPYTTWKRGFDQLIALFNMSNWRYQTQLWQTQRAWNPNGSRRYSSVPNTEKKSTKVAKTTNPWAWPFPSLGNKGFDTNQLFGTHAGNGRKNNFHDGLDFGSVRYPSTTVHAIHGGTVIDVSWMDGLNWFVLTESKDGYYIYYQEGFSTKSQISVKRGETVKTGDVIGKRDTGHVHIGVTKVANINKALQSAYKDNGTWLDPQKLIKEGGDNSEKNTKKSNSSNTTSKASDEPMPRLTIASVNDDKDYIDIKDSEGNLLSNQFTFIEKTKVWDSITSAAKLKTQAEKWIKANKNRILTSLTISAVELPDFKSFKVGDSYYVNNPYVADPQNWVITEKVIDSSSPYESTLTIGDKKVKLTSYQVQRRRTLQKTLNHLQNQVSSQASSLDELDDWSDKIDDAVNDNATAAEDALNQALFTGTSGSANFSKWQEEVLAKDYTKKEDFDKMSENYTNLSSSYDSLNQNYQDLLEMINNMNSSKDDNSGGGDSGL